MMLLSRVKKMTRQFTLVSHGTMMANGKFGIKCVGVGVGVQIVGDCG